MLLGLHTYSFHLHGMGQNWGGHTLTWPRVMDIFTLMDWAVDTGLDGLHITAVDCETTDRARLLTIRDAAEDHGLYLEYNFSLDEEFDSRLTHTLEEGIRIAHTLGSDIGKVSLDLRRPRPLCASRHHPDIMNQLGHVAALTKNVLTLTEDTGVRLAFENHTESFASEILWLIDAVNHPNVGACVDTVNSVMVLEDPMTAIETLAPRSFTNHFCDHRIERDQFGCRFTGVACGDGDIDLNKALAIFKETSSMNRINIEVEWDAGDDDPKTARQKEFDAVVKSIRYCRDVLHI
ncbi:MAG: sugar phosphate isomerase/epimerase [Proteobacteria bacterium]|nr:sugar phosphate isomerase/epimerase [Pseudomonadota bacterium]MBU1583637.1 sugar phosphate isomerase/epimerase [Pseudomonadota bacterium]MBU2453847.1 sugar phosphate isomerase/epimerase [Pseudomonadota bacterium]MBU2629550.1 sugar phosphate isomerase/epimerase [Pseudomonadota bacterium]